MNTPSKRISTDRDLNLVHGELRACDPSRSRGVSDGSPVDPLTTVFVFTRVLGLVGHEIGGAASNARDARMSPFEGDNPKCVYRSRHQGGGSGSR